MQQMIDLLDSAAKEYPIKACAKENQDLIKACVRLQAYLQPMLKNCPPGSRARAFDRHR